MHKTYLLLAPLAVLLATAPRLAQAQTTGSVGIGTTAPDASAALDIVSSSKGLLLPRVAATASIPSPAPGLLVYQTGSPAGFYYNSGTAAAPAWQRLGADNLGNHTATQTLNLQGNALVGTGGDVGSAVGVGIRADGGLNLGQNGTGHNLLLGYQAGQALTPSFTATDSLGAFNLFSGYQSGANTTTGSGNLFVGYQAGRANTTANGNLFIGFRAGQATTTGEGNQFSGFNSGFSNTTGYANVFSGPNSGYSNTTGFSNQYLGLGAGGNGTTGSQNLFVGYGSGFNNVTGSNNTALGMLAGPDRNAPALDNATALGANAVVSQSNSLVLGHDASVGIGTGAPSEKLQVVGTIYSSAGGFKFPDGTVQTTAASGGGAAPQLTLSGQDLRISGGNTVTLPTDLDNQALSISGSTISLTGSTTSVTVPGDNLGNHTATQNLNLATYKLTGNAGSSGLSISSGGSVGIGTTSPAGGLHVTSGNGGPGTGAGAAGVVMSGSSGQPPYLELRGAGTGTGTTPYLDFAETNEVDFSTRLISQGGILNVNGAGTGGVLLQVNGGLRATTYANISDARFKTSIRPIGGALASVLALRGVRYEWNALGIQHGGTAGVPQVGVLAQEVEKIYPELVSTDKDGYKAVNYAQLTPVLIEALKEQQAQLEALRAEAAAAQAALRTVQAQATADKAQATAALETFEARLRRLEAGTGGQAQR